MNLQSEDYRRFKLVQEMAETRGLIRGLNREQIEHIPVQHSKLLLTGEGSSRIFPGKHTVSASYRLGYRDHVFTQTAANSLEFAHSDETLFVASNSGRTAECVRLIRRLKDLPGRQTIGLTTNPDSPVALECDSVYILTCGKEEAVAATKTVVEQALFYDILLRSRNGKAPIDLPALADAFQDTLAATVPEAVLRPLADASLIYFAGRNDGVAEELTLKTNEITRKKADFLEGTYAVHGIEEVMDPIEAVVVVDPFEAEEQKFRNVLQDGVGIPVVAISTRETTFPTFRIAGAGELQPYLLLAAGWNLLVELGLRLSVDLDQPRRARKVGNEFVG